jgi:hypothetical protein
MDAEVLRVMARISKALKALATESTTPTPPTRAYMRWLSLRLFSLSDDLDEAVTKHLPSATALDPGQAPNGTPKEHSGNE